MTYLHPTTDVKVGDEKHPLFFKITAVLLAILATLLVLPPLFIELTALRLFGLLAGANFLTLQSGMLWYLLKNSLAHRMPHIRNGITD